MVDDVRDVHTLTADMDPPEFDPSLDSDAMCKAYRLHAASEVMVNFRALTPWAFLRSPQSSVVKQLVENMTVRLRILGIVTCRQIHTAMRQLSMCCMRTTSMRLGRCSWSTVIIE